MNTDILFFIRNASTDQLADVAIELASADSNLFVTLASRHGLNSCRSFDFPHGRTTISTALLEEIKDWCAKGKKVAAIKAFRAETDTSLYDAKRAVEYLNDKGIAPLGGATYSNW